MTSHRLRIVYIDPGSLMGLLADGAHEGYTSCNGIPADVRPVRAFVDHRYPDSRIGLVIESEEFSPVPQGDPIPVLPFALPRIGNAGTPWKRTSA